MLTDEQRSAIASYFAIYKGHEKGTAKLALTTHLHPAVARARAVLEPLWLQVCRNADVSCMYPTHRAYHSAFCPTSSC